MQQTIVMANCSGQYAMTPQIIRFLMDEIAQDTRQSQYRDMRTLELASIRAMPYQRQLKYPYARIAKGKATYLLNTLWNADRREGAISENTANIVPREKFFVVPDFYESLREF